ncbi:MAG: peptidylprolyl isomerase, partial [Fibrobacteres bacterium]|nr:peptidylprolyl isomerase [Fibrobacterota bacterium]
MKKSSVIALAVLAAVMFAGCVDKKNLAAKVNGEKISISEVDEMISRYVMVSKKIDSTFNPPTGLLLENMRKQFLDGLIDKRVILKKAKELGISISDSEVVEKIAALRKENALNSDAAFAVYLKEMGVTEADFKTKIEDIIMLEKARDTYFSSIAVSPDEALVFYNENGARYAREIMKASHILFRLPDADIPEKGMLTITTRLSRSRPNLSADEIAKAAEAESLKIIAKAESVYKEALSGKPFDALAKKYSEDATASGGGDLGLFGRGDMVSQFDEAVFKLKEGEISSVVKTPFGLHIIKAN